MIAKYKELERLIRKFREYPWENFKYQPFIYKCLDLIFLLYFLHICYQNIELFYLVVYDMNLPGREMFYPYIRNQLTQRNIQILKNDIIIKKYLKRYIRNFKQRYYSPPEENNVQGKGYLIAMNNWNRLKQN